jgi:uncharacterized OB-fold protein/putative sterol carrier protein
MGNAMTTYFGVNVVDVIESLPARFRKEAAADISGSFGYDLEDAGRWRLTIRGGGLTLTPAEVLDDCQAVLVTDPQTFVGIQLGKIDAAEAMGLQKLSVTGDRRAFGSIAGLFQKYLPPGQEILPEVELVVLKQTIRVGQNFATGPVMGRFLKGLKERKILAIRCPVCGRRQSPPREICAVCRVRNTEWVEVGPKGEMRMLEYVYYASPDPLTGDTRETPYGAIGVLLDGCRDEEVFWHLLNPAQLDQVQMGSVINGRVRKGSRLRPVWAQKRTGSIDDIQYFELDT